MDYAHAPDRSAGELTRLLEADTLSEGVTLERPDGAPPPVTVRPVVDGALDDWMPAIERGIGAVNGVVAFSGPDMAETGTIAAGAAAWLGDRGRNIVLVDGSIEQPVLGKPLPEDGDEGLVDAALFGVSPRAVVRRTLSPGVSLVTTGSHPLSVDSVFDGTALSAALKPLADEALVLLLVSPVHLSKTANTLDAAVCVAGSAEELESLASCLDGVRLAGILVRDGEPAASADEAAEAPAEPATPPLVLPTLVQTADRVSEEQAGPEALGGEPEDHAFGDQEPEDKEPEDQRPEETTPPGQVQDPGVKGTPDTAGHEHDEPEPRSPKVLGGASRRRERRDWLPSTVAAVVVLVIAGVIWWNVDGRSRFYSASEDQVAMTGEQVLDGTVAEVGGGPEGPAVAGEGDAAQDQPGPGGSDGAAGANEPGEAGGETVETAPAAAVEPDGPGEEAAASQTGGRPEDGAAISGPGGPYRIMVSSHHRETSARVEAEELQELGIVAEVVPAEIADRGTWYRVLVSGGYPSLASARSVLDTIKTFGYEGAWIERARESR